jgi:hypothetical protein
VGWLSEQDRYEGALPGTDTVLVFAKNQDGYSGCVGDSKNSYTFENKPFEHLVAATLWALDVPPAPMPLGHRSVALGKTLEKLVKAQRGGGAKGAEQHGPPAAPIPHVEPEAPQKTAPVQPLKRPPKLKFKTTTTAPKDAPTLKLSEMKANKPCKKCGGGQVKDGRFRGCLCIRSELQKAVIRKSDSGYTIEGKFDADEFLTLKEILDV